MKNRLLIGASVLALMVAAPAALSIRAHAADHPTRIDSADHGRSFLIAQNSNQTTAEDPRRKKRRRDGEAEAPAAAEQPAQAVEETKPAEAQAQEEKPRRRKDRNRDQAREQQSEQAPAQAQEEQPRRRKDRNRDQARDQQIEQPPAQAQEEQPRRKRDRNRDQARDQQIEQAPAQAREEQPRRRRDRDRAESGDAVQSPEEQKRVVEEAKQPARVSREAEKPKNIVKDEPVAEVVKEAERRPTAVVSDRISKDERQQLKRAEKRRRERARENRNELLGAAAAGVVVGALVPMLGGKVAADEGDRIVVERDGRYYVRKDDSALFRDQRNDVRYEQMRGGLTREIVRRPNGSQIITVRDAGGNVLRRVKITRNGREYVLFDTTENDRRNLHRRVDVPRYRIDIPRDDYVVSARRADRRLFYDTFSAPAVYQAPERYTLQEVRENQDVRGLVRRIDLDTINFDSGSATITESQVRLLGDIAGGMLDVIDENPAAVFLIEGHTDAVGDDLYNLTLSDRRAETVARILTEAYDVPPENMVVQGYGEVYLKIDTQGDERANRRVTVRNITPILETAQN